MSQMSVMQIFDKSDSGFIPRYFIDEKESLEWLKKPLVVKPKTNSEPPRLLIDRQTDKVKLSIEIDSEEFDEYLHLLNKLWKARVLFITVAQQILTLTSRERTILKLLIRGKNHHYISELLFIAPDTVKTHRKIIYRKLGCKRIEDLMKYSSFI